MKLFIIASLLSLTALAAGQAVPGKTTTKEVEYEVYSVHGLNSDYAEFSPVLYKQQLVFTSDRVYDFVNLGEDNWSKTKHVNLFTADIDHTDNDSVVFSKVKIFDDLFIGESHSGPISFSADGTRAIFTKVSFKKRKVFSDKTFRPQLYSVENNNGNWEEIKKLDFVKVNYSYGHPSLSPDGKTLYFVSDDFGGRGGKDIFISTYNGSSWSEPKALNAINSKGDELYPTLLGNELYFSSNGREDGFGGLDLYVSEYNDGEWSEPVNLGNTINTKYDEFGMVYNPDKLSGYFSSNRDSLSSDDIYYFNKIEKVTIEDNSISGKFTYKLLQGEASGLEVQLLDEDGELVERTKTNDDGSFKFTNLESGKRYVVKLLEDGEDVELTLFGKDSESFLISNADGEFIFRKLSPESVGTMALMDEETIDPLTGQGSINGQFAYTLLKSESPDGLEVLLIDEDGNIIERTTTDANGNFRFQKLASDKNYIIKVNNLEEEVELFIYNNNNLISAILSADSEGSFVYRKLESESNGIELLTTDEENLVFKKTTMFLAGTFKYRELNENIGKLPYEIYDEDLNLLMKNSTNEEGYFRHTTIPDIDVIKFKVDPDKYKADMDLFLVDKDKEIVIQLDKDAEGYFVYQKLKGDDSQLLTDEEMMSKLAREGLSGQFKLEKLYAEGEGLQYEIYDEEGMLIKKATTDRYGFFNHPDLQKYGKYKFKLISADEVEGLNVLDENGDIVLLERNTDDYFMLKKLSGENGTLTAMNEDNVELTTKFTSGKMLQILYYGHNIYKLDTASKRKLREVAQFLKTNGGKKIAVVSYASPVGTEEYNKELTERRMREILDYLGERGVNEGQFEGYFYGENDPQTDCKGKDCSETELQNSRRTEIRIEN